MLTVHLVRIQALRSEDLIGQSDPYVVVQVGVSRSLGRRLHVHTQVLAQMWFQLESCEVTQYDGA